MLPETMVVDATVPEPDVTHELPDPLTMVPKFAPAAVYTVIPTAREGLPVVVRAVPNLLAVKDIPGVVDQAALEALV